MKSLQSGGESYIIYNKGNRNEFFMLENRQHDGWDAALPSAGLLIIHVDYDPYAWFYNEPNGDPDHQRFTIVPADGQYDSYQEDGHVVYHYGNSLTDPFPQDGVTSFNKRFKTYDPQAEKAARLYHANADGNYWIDSSVEDIVQHADSTISFNFVAKDQKPNAGYEDFHGENYSQYRPLNGTDIHPTGWLEELMKRQHDGLTGHPEALSYPYNTCLWAGDISRPDEGYGENWWRYEQTAYYTDGLLRLGYEMDDDEMVAKAMEGILWTYGKTGNPKLLQLAEEAWARQDCFAVDATAITSNEPFYMHSVTFCEMLKLPILLYAYTYDEYYYNLAMMAIQKVERESILPDGVPSSAEFLLGDDIDISHETCNVVDYTWTLSQYLSVIGDPQWADKMEQAVYNAGLGSITKDFRSLQYFSSVNQFIATGTSNHNIYKHGSTWMAYRPTHETECCSGNVNRMLPNFVSRMWMEDRHGRAVATLYGPSKATFHTDKGDLTIACETDYPFGETLTFTVSGAEGASIPLVLRIPSWCNNASMMFHDIDYPSLPAGFFIELDSVKSGDVITLTLPMTVEKKVIEGQGVCFQRGPLLFSYAIPQQMTEDTTEYECMHGKKSENPDFKCWNITPTGDFNYAYADDGQEVQLVTMPQQAGSFPYDLDETPVKLRIPVKQIEWNLLDDRYTPELPEQGHLKLLSDETKYIDLVPYGCTELRLTVFPDANACPLPEPEKPDYTRPADAPDCVQELDGVYCAYFEEPRFCWDEPIYCKVRTADDHTTDLQSNVDGDLCEIVGKTAIGRYVWRWTGPAVREAAPVELIFTNHDLLTHVLPFENGGYYNYDRMLYLAGQTTPTGIDEVVDRGERTFDGSAGAIYDLQGRKVADGPKRKGLYISKGKKIIR